MEKHFKHISNLKINFYNTTKKNCSEQKKILVHSQFPITGKIAGPYTLSPSFTISFTTPMENVYSESFLVLSLKHDKKKKGTSSLFFFFFKEATTVIKP